MKKIAVLGSTGSIGTQTLNCKTKYGFAGGSAAAGSNVELMEQQIREFHHQWLPWSEKAYELKIPCCRYRMQSIVRNGRLLEMPYWKKWKY